MTKKHKFSEEKEFTEKDMWDAFNAHPGIEYATNADIDAFNEFIQYLRGKTHKKVDMPGIKLC